MSMHCKQYQYFPCDPASITLAVIEVYNESHALFNCGAFFARFKQYVTFVKSGARLLGPVLGLWRRDLFPDPVGTPAGTSTRDVLGIYVEIHDRCTACETEG